MKFTYQYRTPDNVAHTGELSAANRDAVFAALKAQGVKPFGIAEAPGAFNKLFGKGKRWIAIAILAVAALTVTLLYFRISRTLQTIRTSQTVSDRHQIYGDPAYIDECESTGYANVFTDPGERILAVYAQPGGANGLDASVDRAQAIAALAETKGRPVVFTGSEPREIRELKAIVEGMKRELREYLSDGVGTIESYMKRLEERRVVEVAMYEKVAAELVDEKDELVRESKNEALRGMGLKTIPRPKKEDKNEALKNFKKSSKPPLTAN